MLLSRDYQAMLAQDNEFIPYLSDLVYICIYKICVCVYIYMYKLIIQEACFSSDYMTKMIQND